MEDICRKQPTTKANLLKVSGIKQKKFELYGEDILKIVRAFKKEVKLAETKRKKMEETMMTMGGAEKAKSSANCGMSGNIGAKSTSIKCETSASPANHAMVGNGGDSVVISTANYATTTPAKATPLANNTTATAPASTSSMKATPSKEQLERMEMNRMKALERKREREQQQQQQQNQHNQHVRKQMRHSTGGIGLSQESSVIYVGNNPNPLSSHLSQESDGGTSNSNIITPHRPRYNPYAIKKSVSIPSIDAYLPPLPTTGDIPNLREETLKILSEQQLEVVKLARPPTPSINFVGSEDASSPSDTSVPGVTQSQEKEQQQPGYIVRVTAAAGTGKTTTLLHLALRCMDLGHRDLTYVTFTKASALDAKERIQAMNGGKTINASTLHSCVLGLLNNKPMGSDYDEEKNIMEEHAFFRIMEELYKDELEQYLRQAINNVHAKFEKKEWGAKETAVRKQVVFYLKKTFWKFCQSKLSLDEMKDEHNWERHYYPGECAFPLVFDGHSSSHAFFVP